MRICKYSFKTKAQEYAYLNFIFVLEDPGFRLCIGVTVIVIAH